MSERNLNDALRRGVAAHKSGNLVEAAKLYETVLHVLPDHVDANHNLGLIALSTGKPQLAIAHIEKALAKQPSNFQFRSSYVGALIENGQYSDAKTYISEIKKKDPTDHRFDGLLGKIRETQAIWEPKATRTTRTILRFSMSSKCTSRDLQADWPSLPWCWVSYGSIGWVQSWP